MVLRFSLLAWNLSYLASHPDAIITKCAAGQVIPKLAKRHIEAGIQLAAYNNRILVALLTVPLPPRRANESAVPAHLPLQLPAPAVMVPLPEPEDDVRRTSDSVHGIITLTIGRTCKNLFLV